MDDPVKGSAVGTPAEVKARSLAAMLARFSRSGGRAKMCVAEFPVTQCRVAEKFAPEIVSALPELRGAGGDPVVIFFGRAFDHATADIWDFGAANNSTCHFYSGEVSASEREEIRKCMDECEAHGVIVQRWA